MSFAIGTPEGYSLSSEFVKKALRRFPHLEILETHDPHEAVKGPMSSTPMSGPAWDRKTRKKPGRRFFADYQVNTTLMKSASRKARFMHCLPARRGLEVTDEVIDGRRAWRFRSGKPDASGQGRPRVGHAVTAHGNRSMASRPCAPVYEGRTWEGLPWVAFKRPFLIDYLAAAPLGSIRYRCFSLRISSDFPSTAYDANVRSPSANLFVARTSNSFEAATTTALPFSSWK